MSPLAARLAKLLTDPSKLKANPFYSLNHKRLRQSLNDIHCFEVTEALPLLSEINKTIEAKFGIVTKTEDVPPEQSAFIGQFVFLPAPKTWIEYRHPAGRIGLLLCQNESETRASAELFMESAACDLGDISLVSDDWEIYGGRRVIPPELFDGFKQIGMVGNKFLETFLGLSHWLLVLINSPHIIGRRQIMPHAGLERRLIKSMGAGKFPLHAWTEILLQVSKPTEIDDGEPHESHLTGRRALHFCRKHIRIRNGRMEYVRAHWRGDPAIGIKRSRYVVTA